MDKLINLKESFSKLRLENQLAQVRSKLHQDYTKSNNLSNTDINVMNNNKTCKTNNTLGSTGNKKNQHL